MKLITNRIPLGNSKGFGDFVKEALAERNGTHVKTAQAEEAVAAAKAGEGPSELNEKIEVVAESCNDEGANDGMEPEKGKFPEDQKVEGEMTEADAETEIKVAEGCDQDDQDCVEKGKFTPDLESDQESGEENGMEHCAEGEEAIQKEAGELPDALKEHQFKSKDSDGNDDADGEDDDAEKESCTASSDNACEEKIADFMGKFVKISNLTPEQKKFVADYFSAIYPSDYVDAIVQDR